MVKLLELTTLVCIDSFCAHILAFVKNNDIGCLKYLHSKESLCELFQKLGFQDVTTIESAGLLLELIQSVLTTLVPYFFDAEDKRLIFFIAWKK